MTRRILAVVSLGPVLTLAAGSEIAKPVAGVR
jgi:hypothetical protein